ncbi:LptF/LptG family permease [Alphaproteobacteria bacterium]|nr:LptF/LptG family permease [Alphaproteobacteria bacterium]
MKLKLYLTISYVKYILLMLIVFLLIIWLAQIIRYLDLSQSFSMQFSEVALVTSYLLPNAINTILPIIIFIASCFLNYQMNQTNEISIISLYLSKDNLRKVVIFIYSFLLLFYAINTEILSVESYNKYKIKEIELRNQFKIRDFKNEIFIKDKLNLFYEKKNQSNSSLENVTTYLIEENVVIKSNEVKYIQSNNQLLFTFLKGTRIVASNNEKSYTDFNKLEYKIKNNSSNEISLDKENYNFFELIKHEKLFFNQSAHKRIIDALMFIFILYLSNKIILINNKSKNLIRNYFLNLIVILACFTHISFMSKLFISNIITVKLFYLGSVLVILFTTLIVRRKNAFS